MFRLKRKHWTASTPQLASFPGVCNSSARMIAQTQKLGTMTTANVNMYDMLNPREPVDDLNASTRPDADIPPAGAQPGLIN